MALANITNNILTDSGILVTNLTPTSRTLTINGVTYDLSADRSWSIATHDAVTIGTANGLSLSGQVLSLGLASGSANGALSSTDWTTFNNKQNALTNPVTGTGTTNYLSKFTGTSTIGNSIVQDDATTVTIGGQLYVNRNDSNVIKVARNGGSNLNTVIEFANASSSVHIGSNGTLFGLGGTTGSVAAQPFIIVPSSSERMRLDASGNLGLGVTPSAWSTGTRALQVGSYGALAWSGGIDISMTNNAYYDGTNWVYIASQEAGRFLNNRNTFAWFQAAAGTAGNAISFTQAMTLDASGRLGIGTTSISGSYRLTLNGDSSTNTGGIIIRQSGTDVMYIGNIAGSNTTDFEFWNPRNGYTRFATNNIERMRLDASGNLGLGVTPSAWSAYTAIQVTTGGAFYAYQNPYEQIGVVNNGYFNGSGWIYTNTTSKASRYHQYDGQHLFYTAPSGTAGSAISFTQAMTLNASGNLGIGSTSPASKLSVGGDGYAGRAITATANNADFGVTIRQDNGSGAGLQIFTTQTSWGSSPLTIANSVSNLFTIASTGAATFSSSVTANDTISVVKSKSGTGVENPNLLTLRLAGTGAIGDSANIAWRSSDGSYTIASINGISGGDNVAYGSISFSTRNYFTDTLSEVMRINNRGNVGIGTTSPANRLTVAGSSGTIMSLSNGADADLLMNFTSGVTLLTPTTGILAFGTNSTERMRITSGGNVGIGTSSPGAYILALDYNASAAAVMSFKNSSASGYSGAHLLNNSGALMGHFGYANASTGAPLTDLVYFGSIASKAVVFTTTDTERMRITSGGSLLIGTSSAPSAIGVNDLLVIGKSGSASNAINFSNGSTTNWGYLLAESGKIVLGSGSSSSITFETNGGSERMRITSGGTLLVGTTSEAFAGGKLQVEGTIRAAGQFTSVLPSSNFGYFDGSGQVVASASSASSLYLDATWNTTGNPDAIFLNITNTASGASAKLLNLKVGSVSQFNVSKAGAITTGALTNGTAQPWKLGNAVSGSLSTNHYIIVEINGTTYSIPALQGLP